MNREEEELLFRKLKVIMAKLYSALRELEQIIEAVNMDLTYPDFPKVQEEIRELLKKEVNDDT